MKKLTLPFLLCLAINAFGFSFVPQRVVTPMLDIFNPKNTEKDQGVLVRTTTFDDKGRLTHNGGRTLISKEAYANFQEQASAVYRKQNSRYRGTAFHIGHNLVLTNFHVLDHDRKNASCGDFTLEEREGGDNFPCKKVHFCDNHLDVCLVEMSPLKKKRGCFLCKKERYEVTLAQGHSLKLRDNWSPTEDEKDNMILTAIGNTKGFGIHVSQGKGAEVFHSSIHFYAPLTGGNSGGALLDEEGLVVGVVRAETLEKVGNDTSLVYNVAASSDMVIYKIREALAKNPEILGKFNESVIE